MAGARRGRAKVSGPAASSAAGLGTDKLYFKIGEVAAIVGVEAHVLRFWEREFQALRPSKSRSGQRVYRRRDVELLLKIRHLLYDEKLTIAGARQRLREAVDEVAAAPPMAAFVAERSGAALAAKIAELRAILDAPADPAVDADPRGYLLAVGGVAGLLGDRDRRAAIASRGQRRRSS